MTRFRTQVALWAAMLFLFASAPVEALEKETPEVYTDAQGIVYEIENGEATLKDGSDAGGTVELPAAVCGVPLTTIRCHAFFGQGTSSENGPLAKLIIPPTVVRIEMEGLRCPSLHKITFREAQEGEEELLSRISTEPLIGARAFHSAQIETIEIPGRFRKLESKIFFRCHRLREVTLGEGIEAIDEQQCTMENVHYMRFPDSVTTWEAGATGPVMFYGAGFTKIDLPDSMKEVPDNLFAHCSSLTEVGWPSCLEKIGDGAFADTALTELNLPDGVSKIGANAFGRTKISQVDHWPGDLKTIGSFAFDGTELTEIRVPGEVSLGDGAFGNTKAQEVWVPGNIVQLGKLTFGDAWQDTPLRTMHFGGTAAQWESLIAAEDVSSGSGEDAADSANREFYSGVTVVCTDGTIGPDWNPADGSEWVKLGYARSIECGWHYKMQAICRQGTMDLALSQTAEGVTLKDFSPDDHTMKDVQPVHLEAGQKAEWDLWLDCEPEAERAAITLSGQHGAGSMQSNDVSATWDIPIIPEAQSLIEVDLSNESPKPGEQVKVTVRLKSGGVWWGQLFCSRAVTEVGTSGVLLTEKMGGIWPIDVLLEKDPVYNGYAGVAEWSGILTVWGKPKDEITLGYAGRYDGPDGKFGYMQIPEVATLTISAEEPTPDELQNSGLDGLIVLGPGAGTTGEHLDFWAVVDKGCELTNAEWSVSPPGSQLSYLEDTLVEDSARLSVYAAGEYTVSVHGLVNGREVRAAKKFRITNPAGSLELTLVGPDTAKLGEEASYALEGAPEDATVTWIVEPGAPQLAEDKDQRTIRFVPAASGSQTVTALCQWENGAQTVSRTLTIDDPSQLTATLNAPYTAKTGEFVTATVQTNQPLGSSEITWKTDPASALLEISAEGHDARLLIPEGETLTVEATVGADGQEVTAKRTIHIDSREKELLSFELQGPRTANVGEPVSIRALPNLASLPSEIGWRIEPACAYTLSADKLSLTFVPDQAASYEVTVDAPREDGERAAALHIVTATAAGNEPPESTRPAVALQGPETVQAGMPFTLSVAVSPETETKVLWSIYPDTEPFEISEDTRSLTVTPQSAGDLAVYAFITVEGWGETALVSNIKVTDPEPPADEPSAEDPPANVKPTVLLQGPETAPAGKPFTLSAVVSPEMEARVQWSISPSTELFEISEDTRSLTITPQSAGDLTVYAFVTVAGWENQEVGLLTRIKVMPGGADAASPQPSASSSPVNPPTAQPSAAQTAAPGSWRPAVPVPSAPVYIPGGPGQIADSTPSAAANPSAGLDSTASWAPTQTTIGSLVSASAGTLTVSGSGTSYLQGLTASKEPLRAADLTSMLAIPDGLELYLTRADGQKHNAGDPVGTGTVISLVHPEDGILDKAVVVIQGDVLGTGTLNIAQVVRTAQAVKGERQLEGPYLQAAKWTAGSRVSIADLVRQAQMLKTLST